jgi:poly(A) polymerase
MTLPAADWQRRDGMARLLDLLGAKEGATRYVGGCVRDTLLGLPVSDVDLATRLTPEEVTRRLESGGIKAVPTGIAHGTVTAVLHGRPVEVTTLRRDVATDGRRATIAFTDDWREDAARRDFTINALSADPTSRELFDYFGGADDLAAGRVRFIGDPLTRIAEDHLRILRYFRFHARFGNGEPDEAALAACTARANDLMALSRERIAGELLKLLATADPAPTIALMIERGILRPVLPEIVAAGLAKLERLIRREQAAGIEPDALRRLATLIPADPKLMEAISGRLRLSNADRKRLVQAAEPLEEKESVRRVLGRSTLFPREALDLVLLSDLDEDRVIAEVRSLDSWERPNFPLKGRDLLAMGLPPGPDVARILNRVMNEWADADFPSEEQVRVLARRHVDQVLRSSQ